MNEQNSAAQPLLTGDEIRAAVRQARSMTAPSDTTEPGDYVMAGAQTMLSKLRIPVAEVPLTHRCANCGAVFQGAGCPSCRLAAPMATSPVAGALAYQLRRTDGHPLACWEDCSRQMYVQTLATGRYNGLDLGPPCEVRALGVIEAAPQVWPTDAQMAALEQFIYEDMGSPSDWMGFDRDGARSALASAPVAVPDGWKLVPIEPTPDMIEAGATERITPHASAGHGAVAGYKAMIAAAPVASAPVAGEAVGVVQPNGDTFRLSRPLPVGTKVYAAPQASEAGHDELVYLGGTAPPVPAWLLKSARRISHYMATYHPGEWAIYGIQFRSEPRPSAQGGING